MTQIQLQAKLQQALEDIVEEALADVELDAAAEAAVRDAVRREARLKSIAIHEYLEEHVLGQFAGLEGRIENLEERIRVLGSAGPTSTPTEG